MIGHDFQKAKAHVMLAPQSAANTAAATSLFVDVRNFEGDLQFLLMAGIITGTLDWTLEDATDAAGTGVATIAPSVGSFTQITTSNDPLGQRVTLNKKACRGFVRVKGTIVTGPALVCAAMQAVPKDIVAAPVVAMTVPV